MSAKHVYECEKCGKNLELSAEDAKTPECCDQPMKEISDLDACQVSTTAEHSRFDDFDDACDDGRSGKV
jgi:DNA replicative helicase MCM subunit Mcm2 (Cdc46/Mcm family)